jgi:hypothetical protein
MIGWQRVTKGKSPEYVLGRVADGYQPPERAELGEMPAEGDKDPWTSAAWLPFWDVESREVLIFHAANDGSRDAVASVVECYVNNAAVRPNQTNYDPLIELSVDSYENKHGRRIYFPVFLTIDWVEHPAHLQRVVPPPVKMLQLTAAPAPQPEEPPAETIPTDVVGTDTASKLPPKQKRKTKPPATSLEDDMNDIVPF